MERPQLIRYPQHLLAFGLGVGLSPVAPGTMGTLAAIPLYLLLSKLTALYYLGAVLCMFILGVWLCEVTARHLECHDHSGIVWDEVVGYLVTMWLAPVGWLWVLLGFLLFRFFDVLKPWPIGIVDRTVKGGLGIMLDDLLAGIYAWLVLQALVWSIV